MPLEQVDLADPDTFVAGPPHAVFARLRQESPVFLHHRENLPPFWVVTGYRDVVEASRDWHTFSSQRNGAFLDERSVETGTMVNLDPPGHTRLRGMVSQRFTRQAIEGLTRRIRRRCTSILDRVCEKGECDFAEEVAGVFSFTVLADLMGIPEDDWEHVRRLTTVLDDPLEQTFPDAVERAARQLLEYANELTDWRRRSPADDLVSEYLASPALAGRDARREFELLFFLLITAGHLTTRHLLSGGMAALSENPQQWQLLRQDPALLESGVEEMLRWVTPVMQFQRTATRDTILGGRRIAEGDRVALYYVAANRDPEIFHDPDRFDVARTPNDHVGFGAGGPHFCLGSRLARLQTRIMVEELLRRVPDIEVMAPPEFMSSTFVNGIRWLPVRFTPVPRS
ncbi:cytochrome P450 [Streptosporangium sp. CA-135522]|uniref:cytochrome P450 n=1 Tax=Streptosporangium sp. CA-135522 TaxID=3240072 RepID=UPI003D92E111